MIKKLLYVTHKHTVTITLPEELFNMMCPLMSRHGLVKISVKDNKFKRQTTKDVKITFDDFDLKPIYRKI